jgi:glycosyltransferase involved in cell wall biosynthesis
VVAGVDEEPMVKKVSVVVPAYNEAKAIQNTLKGIKAIPGVMQVVVVDDGSNDDTALLAANMGAKVVKSKRNLGKGNALELGLSHVRGDIILLLDADLGRSAVLGAKLLLPLLEDQADMVVARLPSPKKAVGLGFTLGLARIGTYLLTGEHFQAPLSGQRAFSREVLAGVKPLLPGFGVEVGLNIKAIRGGFRIKELPIKMEHQPSGRDLAGFFHRGRQFWHIFLGLVKLAFSNR